MPMISAGSASKPAKSNARTTHGSSVYSFAERRGYMSSKLHPEIKTAAGSIFINPGTGPVEGATEKNARANMKQFIADCASDLHYRVRRAKDKDYGDGRF